MADEVYHWNINGLKCRNSPNYSDKIKQICSILETQSTFTLNLQETHLARENEQPSFINTYKHLFHFEKTFSRLNDSYSGIMMCIRKTESIMETDILEEGRLLYIKIKNQASEEITHLFSIYCNPGDPKKQKDLIGKLRDKISLNDLNMERCIVMGDFNFVTSILDRNSQSMNRTDLETNKEWAPFEEKMNLQDTFRLNCPSKRLYTFTSKANKKNKARLDRIYCTSSLCGKIKSTIFTPTLLSDHKIVKVKIATEIEKGPGLWVFNNTYLDDPEYCNKTEEILISTKFEDTSDMDRRGFFDLLKQENKIFSMNYAYNKVQENKKQFHENKKELENLESIHQQKLNPMILERMESLREKIDTFEKIRIKGSLLRSKTPHFEENDPSISFLSNLEKRKGEENTIYYLFDQETNTIKNTTSEIKEVVYDFYSNLYKKEPENEALKENFLSCIDKFLDPASKIDFETHLNETMLYSALKSLKDDRSPGPDGLTKEWYLRFWHLIKEPFIMCVKEIEEKNDLAEMQKRGAIKISYKKGDRNQLKNYRPITLLNIDLKIITKCFADRIKKILPNLVHENQTCVPGRHIESNIHLTQNLIDHANEKGRNLALIFLDQEKAFDRLSHDFIFRTLERFVLANTSLNG